MIDISKYSISFADKKAIESMLSGSRCDLSLEDLWSLMDQVWLETGCDNLLLDKSRLAKFYTHPVWLLNGIFQEQDPVSMDHRHSITAAVHGLSPQRIVDFGGGFGTLARLLARALPYSHISICEPFPPQYGIDTCRSFSNITFISELPSESFDVLISTDVLEHVTDP